MANQSLLGCWCTQHQNRQSIWGGSFIRCTNYANTLKWNTILFWGKEVADLTAWALFFIGRFLFKLDSVVLIPSSTELFAWFSVSMQFIELNRILKQNFVQRKPYAGKKNPYFLLFLYYGNYTENIWNRRHGLAFVQGFCISNLTSSSLITNI